MYGIVFLVFATCAFAQNECYYAAGGRAGSAIIPCGGSGYSACCQIGDLCLSDSACWNPTHNVTYLYGCTDPTYQDPTCPWKCGPDFANAPYVGLDYCYNTTQNEWSCTHPPNNTESIQEFEAQQCFDDSIIAFAGPSVLQPILSLPTNVGGSTVWFSAINPTSYSLDPNYTPTTTSLVVTASVPTAVETVSTTSGTDISTTSGPPVAGVTPSSATFTPTSTPASESNSGLSTGAKIGIGVGVAGGVLGLAGIGAAIFFFRRRRSHQPLSKLDETTPTTPSFPPDVKESPKIPAELPSTSARYEVESPVSSWTSPAPTYSTNEPTIRRAGPNVVHEIG